jgi:hypothetical protein
MRRTIPLIVVAVLVLAACGGDAGSSRPSGTTSPAASPIASATTTPEPEVLVTRDLPYASVPEDWVPALLDVYVPPGARDLPLVVLFHGAGLGVDKDSLDYPALAEAIAAGGAVVVAANWGSHGMPWDGVPHAVSAADVVRRERGFRDEGACAVSYAVTHATEYGADPHRLVLFGHSAGANEAGRVGLTETAPFRGCAVGPTSWSVKGLMAWDGDWLLANPGFDVFETAMPRLLEVMTPWSSIATAPDVPRVELAVGDNARFALRTSNASEDAEWLAWRDPTGHMQEVLDALGAFRDGYLDVGEEAEAMVSELSDHGIDAVLLELKDPSTSHEALAEADFEVMVEHVLSLAGTTGPEVDTTS